jgi:hypothetical protein
LFSGHDEARVWHVVGATARVGQGIPGYASPDAPLRDRYACCGALVRETTCAARGTRAAKGGGTMKKTNKKPLVLSKTSIKQLTETLGAAKNVCTFGSTAKQPTLLQPTCLGTCPADNTCATSYPCI